MAKERPVTRQMIREAMRVLASVGGRVRSERKAKAARENAARPRPGRRKAAQ